MNIKKIILVICMSFSFFGIAARNVPQESRFKIESLKGTKIYQFTAQALQGSGAYLKKNFFSKNNVLLRDPYVAAAVAIVFVGYCKIKAAYQVKKKRELKNSKVFKIA